MTSTGFSFTEENYIKTIYMLLRESEVVTTTALASALGTTPASVTDMAGKLKEKRLIDYEKYQGITLSVQGEKAALLIIRRHRLWECFLVDKLGFSWEEVHEIAEELEHVRSTKLTERLSEFLGQPRTDPHGDPIPDSAGRLLPSPHHTLLTIPSGGKLEVAWVTDQSSGLLKFLAEKGIKPGTVLEILQRRDFDHSVEIRINKQASFALSEQVAKNIIVKTHEKRRIVR